MGDFTYEHLFDVLRKERSRDEIQEIEDSFFASAERYVKEQASLARSTDVMSDAGDLARQQLQNSKKLLRELYDRREKKIMALALNKARTQSALIDTSHLLAKELELFNSIVETLSSARAGLNEYTNGAQTTAPAPKPAPVATPTPKVEAPKEPEPTPLSDDNLRVRIKSAVPKFLGSQSETYGPYDEGSEVDLPERIGSILIKKGRAEKLT